VRQGAAARFRPIVLTAVTTFAGLSPLMLEKSIQAQFLIPMAISLAYGVVFATLISLILVPCGYAVIEDLRGLTGSRRARAAPELDLPTVSR
jgi:multidrug efflux pump subunit AcrB